MTNAFQMPEILDIIEQSGLKKIDRNKHFHVNFKSLMSYRIDKILMVCSLYDYYTIVEDDHLQEAIFNEYLEMNLYYAPHITRAYSAESALSLLKEERFDLIILTLRLGDMEVNKFCEKVKKEIPGVPAVLLASQSRELHMLMEKGKLSNVDKIFIWSGDRRIFLAIIKHFEDLYNAPSDCLESGITNIILVEDSPLFYSSYLPLIYTEVMKQTQQLIAEGKNSAEKMLRQRARPKILHAESFEQALRFFDRFKESLLGIITDMKFKMNGSVKELAGVELIRHVKKEIPLLPVALQSSQSDKENTADELGVTFIDKNSRTLLMDLSEFMKNNFGFGDFIFRMPDGTEIQRAKNLREFRDRLKYIPDECLLYHSRQNHFSYWLIARTEFVLANLFRPVSISQFKSVTELRHRLIDLVTDQLIEGQRGTITVYSRANYRDDSRFMMIGEGSLGGKARGLAFIDRILKDHLEHDLFPDVKISIPKSIVIGTDVFTKFMEHNNLYKVALKNLPDEQILRAFLNSDIPAIVLGDLRELLKHIRFPLAVRSSSLLEDAMYQPFAGIYATIMIPNSSVNLEIRFKNLVQAIKYVYASTFSRSAKNYIEATGNRIEEEKMAVILQEVVGNRYGHYYYPQISGVARSFNYYPFGKAKPKDGVVNLALGLGKTIVEGEKSLQYSPAYPKVYPQFGSTKDYFNKSQTKFWALDIASEMAQKKPGEDQYLAKLGISDAEKHKTLNYIASTYSAQNDMLYQGVMRQGPRVITYAPILKSNIVPLNEVVKLLLRISEAAMNSPVEIEFALKMPKDEPLPCQFGFLQVRPMVKSEGTVKINFDTIDNENILFKSENALGNGTFEMNTILYVKPETFDPAKTRMIAEEINRINKQLLADNKFYLLIGPGRWGSSDPWLGIPVDFSYIAGAQVIVETTLPQMNVDPSQGSHFFQNMTSFKIAYFTVRDYGSGSGEGIDWNWLAEQPAMNESHFLRLVRLDNPLIIKVDGQSGKGVALKKQNI